MSPAPILKRSAETPQSYLLERRLHSRYSIGLNLQYWLRANGTEHRGSGRTVNISSSGVMFEPTDIEADDVPNQTELVVLRVDWPFPLNEDCALKLEVHGRIVRREPRRLALEIVHHEFRTGPRNLARQPNQQAWTLGAGGISTLLSV
jgi:hypothetical protein